MSTVEQPATKGDGFVGRAMKRKEDPRMVTGRGEYVDDLALPGMVWAALVRSPEAHAKIVSIDKSAAQERPDVVGVFTHEDLKGDFAAPMPMVWDPAGDRVTLYSATQIPHIARFVLSLVTGMPEDKLRVVAPDVGGAFGSKINVFVEEVLAVLLARRLGRPVKWIETRSENMAVVHHGRDVIDYVELAAKRDGTVTGLRLRVVADLGAYFMQLTPWIPKLGFPVANGCYRLPNIELKFECVFTNKNPTDAIRGAGRPERHRDRLYRGLAARPGP